MTVVQGKASAAWSTRATVIVVGFGVIFVVALAGGTLVVPGGLGVLLFVRELRPPLFLAPTASGVHVCSQTLLTGNPKRVVATLAPMPFPAREGKSTILWGDRTIGVSAKEYRELVRATAALGTRPPPPPLGTLGPSVVPASSWPSPG